MSNPLTNNNIPSSFVSTRNTRKDLKVSDVKAIDIHKLETLLKEVENESIKYGIDLLNVLNNNNKPNWGKIEDTVENIINELSDKKMINKADYSSLKMQDKIYFGHKIATAESLTSGLIMSTLVDIPSFGYLKYGGFMVYDTDAKRTFIGVTENNVYTEKCAIQMAKGILLNSNATIAIAVTGHAMPLPSDTEHIGKVDICIAGYDDNNNIIYSTSKLESCNYDNPIIKKACKQWKYVYNTKKDGKQQFVSSKYTALISKIIRYITVIEAYKQSISFITNYNPSPPTNEVGLKKRILDNLTLNPQLLPKSKYFNLLPINTKRAQVKRSILPRMARTARRSAVPLPTQTTKLAGTQKLRRSIFSKVPGLPI
jgi:PncC family amidohydrolase